MVDVILPPKPKKTTPKKTTPKRTTSTPSTTSGGSKSSGSKSSGSSGSSGSKSSGSKSSGGASSAEKRMIARENKAKKKAGQKYLDQAKNLQIQANALKIALNKSYAKARDQNLVDLNTVITQQINMLKRGAAAKTLGFLSAAKDSDKAQAATSEEASRNFTRERADSMTGVLENGAGETDALRTMVIAARNWASNQNDANRSYFDSLASINQGITDLTQDTRTALAGAYTGAEGERERLWQDFYNKRSEAFTQLGNIYGQQADYYASAKEMDVSPGKGKIKDKQASMKKAFKSSATELGKSYVNKGIPKWVQNYEAAPQVERKVANTNLAAATEFQKMKKAEGATLRKWAA